MKTKIILSVIFSLLSTFGLTAQIQTTYKEGYAITQREGSDMVRIERESQNFLKNFNDLDSKSCRNYNYESSVNFDSLCTTVFDKEKIEKLAQAKAVMPIYLACNMKGQVIGVYFSIVRANITDQNDDLSNINLNEIRELDILIRNCFYKITSSNCPEAIYFNPRGKTYYFENLLKYINTKK